MLKYDVCCCIINQAFTDVETFYLLVSPEKAFDYVCTMYFLKNEEFYNQLLIMTSDKLLKKVKFVEIG